MLPACLLGPSARILLVDSGKRTKSDLETRQVGGTLAVSVRFAAVEYGTGCFAPFCRSFFLKISERYCVAGTFFLVPGGGRGKSWVVVGVRETSGVGRAPFRLGVGCRHFWG